MQIIRSEKQNIKTLAYQSDMLVFICSDDLNYVDNSGRLGYTELGIVRLRC